MIFQASRDLNLPKGRRAEGTAMRFSFFRKRLPLLLAILSAGLGAAVIPTAAQNAARPIRLSVDLREAPRRIFHAQLVLPAKPGPMTLLYPKWIPGEHAPDGPIADLVGLKISAGGRPLAWSRDDADVYAFHIDVPADADTVEASYDYLSPADGSGFSAGPTADPVLAVLEWNLVVLYPAGATTDSLTYQASLRLPPDWKFASALTVDKQQGQDIDFQAVSLTNLVDSPVLTGQYFRSIALAPDVQPPHHLDIAADSAAALEISPEQTDGYSALVREAGALFGARHYNHYDFLLSLTDSFYPNGLEHHQSTDVRASERMLVNPDQTVDFNSLLSHEYSHSWNGKYRRPAGLATPDFEQPMKDDLLWVYEGLTEYLGEMLSARAGLRTADDYRDELAWTAAYLDRWPGRTWRPLEDTAVAAVFLYDVPGRNWESWRRSVDFYDEGWLIWLDADIIIRRESKGKKSLDDFCKRFYGAPGPPAVVPYTLDDVIAAMNQVLPYDWRGFFHARVDEITEHPPTGGIDGGGWKLVFNDTPNQHMRATETVNSLVDASFSLGLRIESEGEHNDRLGDVIPGTPAAAAGLAPGMRLISVNGRPYTSTLLADAIQDAKSKNQPITLTCDNSGFVRTYEIQYTGGERYPHLERNASQADLLSQTLQPLTKSPAAK
jgi:predicted metalloprotease with PDZ domain